MNRPTPTQTRITAGSLVAVLTAFVLVLSAINDLRDEAGEMISHAFELREPGPQPFDPLFDLTLKIDTLETRISTLEDSTVTKLSPKMEFHFLIHEALDSLGLSRDILLAEVKFHKTRQWRFDYAIPTLGIAFEYEGRGQGHLSWSEYSKDCEKYTWANNLDWKITRITPGMIQDGRAGRLIRDSINFAINPSLANPYKRPTEFQIR